MTTLPSDNLHNVFLADRSEAVPDKKNITVRAFWRKAGQRPDIPAS
jgi:hypothetical protein